jgi:hypothetical protein
MPVSVFVEGEPVTSGGRRQDEWQSAIRSRCPRHLAAPSLIFIVSSLTRHGQPFDLDNLVHPVLMVFDEPIDAVRARLYVGVRPGVLIESDDVPVAIPTPEESLYVPVHSSGNARDREGIPALTNAEPLRLHEGIGVSLRFDSPEIPIRHGWFGPTEAVIDDLAPLLGTYTRRQLVADHRIRDLRISRGHSPNRSGVAIDVWYVPDRQVSTPLDLAARIESLA